MAWSKCGLHCYQAVICFWPNVRLRKFMVYTKYLNVTTAEMNLSYSTCYPNLLQYCTSIFSCIIVKKHQHLREQCRKFFKFLCIKVIRMTALCLWMITCHKFIKGRFFLVKARILAVAFRNMFSYWCILEGWQSYAQAIVITSVFSNRVVLCHWFHMKSVSMDCRILKIFLIKKIMK